MSFLSEFYECDALFSYEAMSEKAERVGGNGEHSLFIKRLNGHNLYRLYFSTFLGESGTLHEVLNELRDAGNKDELECIIQSNGGSVSEGTQFYNIIKNVFYGRTTTILDNKGASMGALLFLMGDRRVVYPHSDIMFHTYSTLVGGKSGEIKDSTEYAEKSLGRFFKELVLDPGYMTEKEYKDMQIGKDYYFDTVEMCERGICTHVMLKGKEITAKQYLKTTS